MGSVLIVCLKSHLVCVRCWFGCGNDGIFVDDVIGVVFCILCIFILRRTIYESVLQTSGVQ